MKHSIEIKLISSHILSTKMEYEEIREKVSQITSELVRLGFSSDKIIDFWIKVLDEAEKK